MIYFGYYLVDNDPWEVPDFLLQNLASPFAMSNITAQSALTLIFNSLANVGATYPNSDPFFLTKTTANDKGEFEAGQKLASLVCRDQIQLKLD